MKETSKPPCEPIRWAVKIGDVMLISPPRRTAFAAAASVRRPDGQAPHFSECQCTPVAETTDGGVSCVR